MRTDITAEFFENELGFAKQKAQSIYEKIKDNATWKISTIWGIGYKFEVHS